jgi:hypothetical protein
MRRLVIAAVSMAVVSAGCALFYDMGTGGFTVSGEAGAGIEDCGADVTCPALSLGCLGSQDCDGGLVCCLIIGGQSSAQSACRAAPCPGMPLQPFPGQLCQGDQECSQSTCVSQTCVLGTNTVGLRACGLLPMPVCTP